jgi:RHS repeat-associated protein
MKKWSICKLIDPRSKKVVHHYEYSSFGEPKEVKSESNPWRYSGKRHDDELKLINYGKRYYDAEIGRFLTPDPAGFLDSVNLYQYAFNNPYSYYDPNGEFIFLAAIPFAALLTRAAVKIFVDAIVAGVATWGAYETGKVVAKEVGSSYTLSEFGWRTLVDNTGIAGGILDYAVGKSEDKKKKETPDPSKKPPYDGKDLGTDPTKCPGEGFKWKGKGSSASGKGSWHNDKTKESLHPDFNYPGHKPHWDYEGPDGQARLNTDGTWEWK